MLDAPTIRREIARALSIVTTLTEGGIDPFTSTRAEQTLRALVDAQDKLEEAERLWRQPLRNRRKRGTEQPSGGRTDGVSR